MANKNIPQLRFAGFEREWDNLPLSAYLTTSHDKNKDESYSAYDVMSVSREFGVVNQIEYQGRSFAGASLTGYGVAKRDDVIYTKSPLRDQPYGIIKTSNIESGIVSALYAIYHPADTVYPQFVQTYFDSDDRLNDYLRPLVHKGAKNTLNIGDDEALNGYVHFPQRDEQIQITSTINSIDRKIQQQRELCDKLRRLKSSLLDKLFPKAGCNVPEMRLEGFEGEWNTVSLSEITSRIKRKNENLESELVMTISSQYGLIDQLKFFNKSVAGADLTNYYLMYNGEYAYNKSYSAGFPWGSVKRLDRYDKGIVSNLYIVFSLYGIDSDFFSTYFMTNRWFNQLSMVAKEGARNHGLLNVSADDFLNLKIQVPQQEEEASEIGRIIKKYDILIELNEAKLAKLRTLKSAMLDKLFV